MARSAGVAAYANWTRRVSAVLGSLERLATDLADVPGRKSILLVSEEFLRDQQVDEQYRRVVDRAQRSNTAIYFSAARGLSALSTFGVDSRAAARPGDIPRINAEQQFLAVAGGEHLADATGGVAVTSNDLAAGLERMATDSAAYYLLGFPPERATGGSFRKLEVKVARKGVTVRARRGYMAGLPSTANAKTASTSPGNKTSVEPPPDLLAGGVRTKVPLRLAAYVQGPDVAGSVRVLVTLEVDGRHVRSRGGKGSLDIAILGMARDQPKVLPLRQTLEMTLGEADVTAWWAFFREIRLPPGVAQVRAMVRDRATGAVGTVSQRLEVPHPDAPYLSTPLITERTQPPLEAGEPPRLVPSASRSFPSRTPLFFQYEVFGFGGVSLPGVARVLGGYTLKASDGSVLAMELPTPIQTDGTRVVRRVTLPVESLEPGAYEVLLTVEDQLAKRTLSARESFTLEASTQD
jgi:hypothetical protein